MKGLGFLLIFLAAGCLESNRSDRGRNPSPNPTPIVTGRELNGNAEFLPELELEWGQNFCDLIRKSAKVFHDAGGGLAFTFKVKEQTFEGKTLSHDKTSFTIDKDFRFVPIEDPQDPAPYKGSFFEFLENGQSGFNAWVCKNIFPPSQDNLPPKEVNRWQLDARNQSTRVIRSFMTAQGDIGFEWKTYSSASSSAPPLLQESFYMVLKNSGDFIGKVLRQDWFSYNQAGKKRSLNTELIAIFGL